METREKQKYISFLHWRQYTGARKVIAHLAFRVFIAFALFGIGGLILSIVDIFIDIPNATIYALMIITGIIGCFAIGGVMGAMTFRKLAKETLQQQGLDLEAENADNTIESFGIPSLRLVQWTKPPDDSPPLDTQGIKQLAYDRVEPRYIWYMFLFICTVIPIGTLVSPLGHDVLLKYALGVVIAAYIGCAFWERAQKREMRIIERETESCHDCTK
jgi:hypothetical protein